MRIALITCNIAGIDEVIKPAKQTVDHDYFIYTEDNLPFPLPNLCNRLKAKYIKLQSHRFLDHDIIVYIDGRVSVIHELFLLRFTNCLIGNDIVLLNHEERKNVFEELNFILDKIHEGNEYLTSRYANQQMEEELFFYQDNVKDLENVGLYGGGFFARWNNKKVNDCFDEWWRRTIEFSYFDQAMLSYALGKHKLKIMALRRDTVLENLLHLGKHIIPTINCTSELVLEDIKYHLEKHRPLAVLRYGDGEAMILDKEGSIDDKNFIFKRQLGYIPTDKEREEIIENLAYAYNNCNTIGVPTEKHEEKGSYWQKAIPILKSYGVMDNVQTFCSINLHYDLLYTNKYAELLTNLDTLYYVSCRNIDKELKQKFNINKVYSHIIPPEMKFTSGHEGERHFPDEFDKVRTWIKGLGECNGKLILIGAGVVGKIYGVWFKEQGGVSIDIGSIFDSWSGKNTRGPERKLDAIDKEFQL